MICEFDIDEYGKFWEGGEEILLEVGSMDELKDLYIKCLEKVRFSHINPLPSPASTEITETEEPETEEPETEEPEEDNDKKKKKKDLGTRILKGKFIISDNYTFITLRAINDDYMKEIVEKIEKMYNYDLSKLKFTYPKKKNIKKGPCGYLQGMNYDEEIFNYPSFQIKCSNEDKYKIKELIGGEGNIKSIFYPERKIQTNEFMKGGITKTKYPIYILTKSRFYRDKKYQKPKTIQYLDTIGVDYKLIVEPQELEDYAKSVPRENMIVLPEKYLNKNQGGIPARNFIHHLNCADDVYAYWILDDNIPDYIFLDHNRRYKVRDAIAFRMVEDCMDNFDNCYLASHQQKYHAPPLDYRNIIQYQGRAMSSILIRTDITDVIGLNDEGDIWRGKYNEDVDLSIRVLKKGLPTLLFINMNQDKVATGSDKGGNTDSIYMEDGNGSGVLKTKEILEKHPDCVKPEWRYGRLHHKIVTKHFEDNGEKLIKSKDFKEHKYNIEYFE